jgi:Protein of unknown function (DUF4236)
MSGAHLTVGHRGITRTVGIPGTGIYYTSRQGYHSGFHSAHIETSVEPRSQARANTIATLGLCALAALVVLVIGIVIGSTLSH